MEPATPRYPVASSSPRVVLVGRSIAHFRYYETVVSQLLDRDARVTLLFDKQWSSRSTIRHEGAALDAFVARYPSLRVDWARRRSDRWRAPLFAAREIRSYASYLRRGDATTQFYVRRWAGYLPEWLRKWSESGVVNGVLGRPLLELALGAFERLAPACPAVIDHLRCEQPDYLLASPVNQRFSEEVEYVKAAKSLGIPVGVITLSWDNLSTKGLLHVQPDRLFIWNEVHREDAIGIHGVPAERLSMCGSPFFDRWFNPSRMPTQRSALCQRMGIDPEAGYLLYLGSSKNIATNECWVVAEIHRRLRAAPDPLLRRASIVIRPHPANTDIYGPAADLDGVVVYPAGGALPQTAALQDEFRDMLQHCMATAGINTTAMLDALVAGRPCLSILLPEYDRTQRNARHFRVLMERDALDICRNFEEFLDRLQAIAQGDDLRLLERRRFSRWFARPRGLDRPAGAEIAEEVLDMIRTSRPRADAAAPSETGGSGSDRVARKIQESIGEARQDPAYRHYLEVRRAVLDILASQPTVGALEARLAHLLDASPLLVRRLREQGHLLGEASSSLHRSGERRLESALSARYQALRAADKWSLFIAEAPDLGGFGYDFNGQLVNTATLANYEAITGLREAGLLNDFLKEKSRQAAFLGVGCGGLVRAFKLRFPQATCLVVDEPSAFLVSATYLMTVFPDARVLFVKDQETLGKAARLSEYDFVFCPLSWWTKFDLRQAAKLSLMVSVDPTSYLDAEVVQDCVEHCVELETAQAFLLLPPEEEDSVAADLLHALSSGHAVKEWACRFPRSKAAAPGGPPDYRHVLVGRRTAIVDLRSSR